jgi:hypothetical protein
LERAPDGSGDGAVIGLARATDVPGAPEDCGMADDIHSDQMTTRGTNADRCDAPAHGSGGPGRAAAFDLEAYLREVSVTAPLTADEEWELGLRIALDRCPLSRERMVRANLRLVAAIAKNYSGRGLAAAELVEAGNAGLISAVEGFDPSPRGRLSTWASWSIKQAMRRAIRFAEGGSLRAAAQHALVGGTRNNVEGRGSRLGEDVRAPTPGGGDPGRPGTFRELPAQREGTASCYAGH